jgi:hypothetical protein
MLGRWLVAFAWSLLAGWSSTNNLFETDTFLSGAAVSSAEVGILRWSSEKNAR